MAGTSNLKILSADIRNFKNLTQKEVEINGKSIVVIGSNAQGKSSFLQAVFGPFMKTYIPLEPIKKGEERGSCSVKIGGQLHGIETQYTIEMYFSPEHERGRLVLLDKDGVKVKGAKVALDAIIGDISFDVDKFLALAKTSTGGVSDPGVQKQVEMLKRFMKKDVQKQLMQCELDKKKITLSRTELNSEIKVLKAKAKHDFSDEQLELYAAENRKPTKGIRDKMSKVGDAIEYWNRVNRGVSSLEEKINDKYYFAGKIVALEKIHDTVTTCYNALGILGDEEFTNLLSDPLIELKAEIGKCKTEKSDILQLKVSLFKYQKWIKKHPKKPTMDGLLDEQAQVQEFNKQCDQVADIRSKFEEIRDKTEETKLYDNQLKDLKAKKKQIFIDNPLPVEHLTFDENRIMYKGLPFSEGMHPTSTIIGVGVQIAMAMNPNLKIIIIKDGSLLDKKVYNKILKIIEEQDFQLFIERVDWNQSGLEIKFAEKEV